MTALIVFLSAFLQLAAALLALRLNRLAKGSWGWLLLAAAIFLMAVRRCVAGYEILVSGRGFPLSELLSLVISGLILGGLVGLEHLLGAGRRAEDALLAAEARVQVEHELVIRREEQALEAQEREIATRKASELGRFLELVVDTANVWVSTLDAEGRAVVWNRGAEAISGYAREEVLGRSDFWEWLYPEPREQGFMASEMAALIRRGESTQGEESTLRRKDGSYRTVAWYICPIILEDGQPGGSLAIGHDVTELRGTQEDLHRIKTFQDLILDNSALGLTLVRQRAIHWINVRGAEILGKSSQEARGMLTRSFFVDDSSYQAFASSAYSAMAKGGYWDTRVRLKKPNGSLLWCRLVGKALNPDFMDDGVVWMIEDISAKMVVEAALAESEERFRGAFEGTQDALLLLTPKGIFDCNGQALRLFGLQDKSEILQKGLKDLGPVRQPSGEASEVALGHYLQSALVGETVSFEWHFRRLREGDFRAQVRLNAFPMGRRKVLLACVRPASGPLEGGQDPAHQAGIRLLLGRSPLATMIVDSEARRIVYCNPAILAMLRCSLEEVVGLAPEDLSPPYQPSGRVTRDFALEMDAIALHGGSHRFRHTHRSPHRGDFAVDVTLTALQPGFSPLLVVNWTELSG